MGIEMLEESGSDGGQDSTGKLDIQLSIKVDEDVRQRIQHGFRKGIEMLEEESGSDSDQDSTGKTVTD